MKYKLVKFTNGLGETWYQIKILQFYIGKFGIYRWHKTGYDTDYGWTSFVAKFKSPQEAHDYLKQDNDLITKINLKNTVMSSESSEVYEI